MRWRGEGWLPWWQLSCNHCSEQGLTASRELCGATDPESLALEAQVSVVSEKQPQMRGGQAGLMRPFLLPSASSTLPSLPRALEGAEVIIWDGAE